MSKQNTPIEELIEKLINSRNERTNNVIIDTLTIIIEEVETYLPKEKEAIEEANFDGKNSVVELVIDYVKDFPEELERRYCNDDYSLKDESNQYYTDKYGK